MANTVKLKRSATPSAVPTTGQLDLGEVAINTYDGKMYIKKDNGAESIVDLTIPLMANASGTLAVANGGTGLTTLTANNVVLGNGSSTPNFVAPGTSGNVLTSNGTTWVSSAPAAAGGSVYYKDPVRVATTANGALATAFANGSIIDGVTLATGDRILIKNQSTASQNGIYVVNASGAPTRASDFDADAEVVRGCQVYVQFGTVNGGNNFQVLSSNGNPIVVGVNTIVFGPLGGVFACGPNTWTAPVASGTDSIAIGNAASVTGANGISIGKSVSNSGSNIIIGEGSSGTYNNSSYPNVVIGKSATSGAGGGNQISIGTSANSLDSSGIAIGGSSAAGNNNIAIGANAVVSNPSNWGSYSIAIGNGALGGSISGFTARGGIAIGEGASTRPSVTQVSSIAIGTSSTSRFNGVAIGHFAYTDFDGQISLCNARFASAGDISTSFIPAYQTTTSGSAAELGTTVGAATTTPTGRIALTNDSSYIFDCDIIARNTATDTENKAWNLKFAIRRGAGAANTGLIGNATKTVIGEDVGATAWDVSVSADTTNGRPNISVTGEASKTIRWVANIRMTKVSG